MDFCFDNLFEHCVNVFTYIIVFRKSENQRVFSIFYVFAFNKSFVHYFARETRLTFFFGATVKYRLCDMHAHFFLLTSYTIFFFFTSLTYSSAKLGWFYDVYSMKLIFFERSRQSVNLPISSPWKMECLGRLVCL